MSLDWDATKVEGFDSLTEDEAVTRDALIWATMAVGINKITSDNTGEFFSRASFWEKTMGSYRYDENGEVYLTRDDVVRFVGLQTNVSPETETQFVKNVWKAYRRFR